MQVWEVSCLALLLLMFHPYLPPHPGAAVIPAAGDSSAWLTAVNRASTAAGRNRMLGVRKEGAWELTFLLLSFLCFCSCKLVLKWPLNMLANKWRACLPMPQRTTSHCPWSVHCVDSCPFYACVKEENLFSPMRWVLLIPIIPAIFINYNTNSYQAFSSQHWIYF